MTQKIWTKQEIVEKLETNQNWLEQGILAIYRKQTAHEQSAEMTDVNNGIGFNSVDAYILSEFAKWILSGRHLTPKQKTLSIKKIRKYAGQLVRISNGEI